jgi:hypothetical protein
VSMMAAMMLPGAVPAVVGRIRTSERARWESLSCSCRLRFPASHLRCKRRTRSLPT